MSQHTPPADQYLDGNMLAGPLAEIFSVDLTTALTTCTGCGRHGALAELRLYPVHTDAPGMIARCPACDNAVARYARTPSAAYLDLRGTIALAVPMGEDGTPPPGRHPA